MKLTRRALTVCVATISALALSGCTTNGGDDAAKGTLQATPSASASTAPIASSTPTSKGSSSVTSSSATDPVVTGAAGSAPVIAAPTGSAPTTLVVHDIYPGNGAVVTPTSTLTVQYTLMAWSTGKVVESSWSGSPATFPLAGVIQGWQQGLPGMKAGGRRLLVIPPALGYGNQASGPLKANETLIFVVDVLQVK